MGKAPVLIADPDARVASLAAHGLRKEGFEVLVANRGEDALAMLAGVPSLVFCEVALPGVDGYALCENARREPATRDVPFFLLSRQHEKADHDRAAAAKADDLLGKPLYARDLLTLARLFSGRPAGTATIEGDLKELSLFHVLRALTSGWRSGELHAPREQGLLLFREGKVIDAQAGELTGDAAVSRLLLLAEGPFTLKLTTVLARGTMSYSLRDLVTHDEPRRRRFEKAMALMGGPGTRLAIDFAALTRELPKLPASIEQIVRLFDGKRSLVEALRASDLDEVTTAEAVLRLRVAGVLTLSPGEEAAPKGEVKLFEPRDDEALLEMKKLFPEGAPPPAAPPLPETTPREVRDWFQDIVQRTPIQDLMAVKDGGWVAQPASEASKQLLSVAGAEATADIDAKIEALGGPAAPAPSAASGPAAPAPRPAAPAAVAPAPAPVPASAPRPAPSALPIPLYRPAPPARLDEHFPDETFFVEEPEGLLARASAAFSILSSSWFGVGLIVVGALALGVSASIFVQYLYARANRPHAAAVVPALPPVVQHAAPRLAPPPPPPEPTAAEVQLAEDVPRWLSEGKALYDRGQANEALVPLEKAAAAAPTSAGAQVLLSLARLDAGKFEGAEAAARRAIELAADEPRAHLALGSVLQARGQNAAARAAYETYLKLAPRGEHAADVRAILSRLH